MQNFCLSSPVRYKSPKWFCHANGNMSNQSAFSTCQIIFSADIFQKLGVNKFRGWWWLCRKKGEKFRCCQSQNQRPKSKNPPSSKKNFDRMQQSLRVSHPLRKLHWTEWNHEKKLWVLFVRFSSVHTAAAARRKRFGSFGRKLKVLHENLAKQLIPDCKVNTFSSYFRRERILRKNWKTNWLILTGRRQPRIQFSTRCFWVTGPAGRAVWAESAVLVGLH